MDKKTEKAAQNNQITGINPHFSVIPPNIDEHYFCK